MKHVDEILLEEDSQQRYSFLAEFIGFGPEDVKLIQGSARFLGPRIGELVDSTYEKLMAYDATARHFLPKQHGFEGEPPADLAELTASHPQIQFRKDHLNRYSTSLIGRSYDSKMVQYLEMVGKMHTAKAGSSEIQVPLIQMNALMGLLSDILTKSLIDSPLDGDATLATIRAFQKLLWIQNDFINRHYVD
jgi:hypothetical protein